MRLRKYISLQQKCLYDDHTDGMNKDVNGVEPINYSKIWNQLLSRLFQQLTRTIISPPDLILKGCFIVVNSLNQCPKCYVLTIGLELAVKTRD